ncbi:MAG TPA: aminotransferase class I and II [Edaphocola sp.]|nr:aminotransferase class I and II [Edaphocola sp.]
MNNKLEIRTVAVSRYVLPLREGGSLPALADADDGFQYVVKFRGAGQGVKMLIAELLGGEIARYLGLKVPELVFANLNEAFGRTEGDEEIQDLLKFSEGLNLGLHFLSGAFTYDPVAMPIDPALASMIVWLDAFITNVDRTYKNTNMLIWKNELWLIDHGAAFYFQHNFDSWAEKALSPFPLIKNHVLLPFASKLDEVNEAFVKILNFDFFNNLVQLIPDEWLQWPDSELSPEVLRSIYAGFLSKRLSNANIFVNEAKKAHHALI